MKWKILLTDGLSPITDEALLASVDLADKKGISAEELLEIVCDYDGVIVRSRTKITEDVLAAASKLKVVGRMGVGVDNIDLKAAAAQGVTVVNAPEATSITVAEHTLGLMLSLIRGIPKADGGMKSGQWLKKELVGTELNQKILGIIGFGNIGKAVAKRAQAFGMDLIAYDKDELPDTIRNIGVERVGFETLLTRSDLITLHVPHNESTHHMINEKTINMMKDGVLIICTARGGVIDEDALLAALESGKVGGAALDVFATEPPGSNPLPMHPRVVATPHIGAQTKEAQLRAGYDILSEVVAALDGQPLRWKIV